MLTMCVFSWIVSGTYYDLQDSYGERSPKLLPPSNGPLRSSLASPELQQWLPDTMASFARQTGAGGFSFDYTYFEQNLDGGQSQVSANLPVVAVIGGAGQSVCTVGWVEDYLESAPGQ